MGNLIKNTFLKLRGYLPFLSGFNKVEIAGSCLQCGRCCQNLCLMNNGSWFRSESEFLKFREEEGSQSDYHHFEVSHLGKDGLIRFKCLKLNVNGSCSIYSSRPELCASYPHKEIFSHGAKLLKGCGYRLSQGDSFEAILAKKEKSIGFHKK